MKFLLFALAGMALVEFGLGCTAMGRRCLLACRQSSSAGAQRSRKRGLHRQLHSRLDGWNAAALRPKEL